MTRARSSAQRADSVLHTANQARAAVRRSRGAVLVAALVGLLVVMLISAALVRRIGVSTTATASRTSAATSFLVRRVGRATRLARLQISRDYTGENWTVTLEFDGEARLGTAEISVQPVATDPNQRQITVEARWSDQLGETESEHRVLEQRQLTIGLSPAGAAS